MRQIVLDTETTGLEPSQGHRIIEIGCVELNDRRLTGRHYHQYINPDREVDLGAFQVHGISNDFLADKPRFAEIAEEFLAFVDGAELIIHNAPFDIGFINHEFKLLASPIQPIETYCEITDTLVMARKLHPGQKNNLDALCKRYSVNNTHRELHGALLDSEILALVYLAMTSGQDSLFAEAKSENHSTASQQGISPHYFDQAISAPVILATTEELQLHTDYLEKLGDDCVWRD